MATAPRDDCITRFEVARLGLMGRLVRLGPAVGEVLVPHQYPEPVAALLGELVAVTAALVATLKFEGKFILQTKGDGAVPLMVANSTTDGGLRGYADFDPAALAADSRPEALLGHGHMVLTVDQGPETDQYRGIVALTGGRLADNIEAYFRQSEQIPSALAVAARRVAGVSAAANGAPGNGAATWRAGCLMVQTLPEADPDSPARADTADSWDEARALMASVSGDELTDPDLDSARLLARLFGAGNVTARRPRALRFACQCSRARAAGMLEAMPATDRADMAVDGRITVTCGFCNSCYEFKADDFAGADRDR